jgi:hypothetical protein
MPMTFRVRSASGLVLLLLLFGSPVGADTITLNAIAFASASDDGPQDGIFDDFIIGSGSIANNGFTNFRTALEFGLAAIPSGSSVNSATLTLSLNNFEGTRSLRVDAYAGDGSIELTDFALDGFLTSLNLGVGSFFVTADATSLVSNLLASGNNFVGFNLREDPANSPNFLVMFVDEPGAGLGPSLSIDFSPVPEPGTLALLGTGLAILVRRQRHLRLIAQGRCPVTKDQ